MSDDLRERVLIENIGDGIADIEHQHSQAAVFFVGTGAFLILRLADASDGCEGAVDHAHDLAHGDGIGGFGEGITAEPSTFALDDAGFAELDEDLFEKSTGDTFFFDDFVHPQEFPSGFLGKSDVDQSA